MEKTLQINHLLLSDPQGGKANCQIFVAQPTPRQLERLGRIFAILELDYYDPQNNEILNFIIRELEENYYKSAAKIKGQDIEGIFEDTLQKLNQTLSELIQNNEIYLALDKFNALVGVLKDEQVVTSQIGNMQAFVIHRDKQKKYKMINILGTPEEKQKINPSKIFSNIISGHININDTLLFCNRSLSHYVSNEKLKEIISTYSPFGVTSHLKNLLQEVSSNMVFAALVIKLTPKEIKGKKLKEKDIHLPQRSLEELIATEESTEKFLTPSLGPKLKESLVASSDYIKKQLKKIYKKKGDKTKRPVRFKQRPLYQKFLLFILALIKQLFLLIKWIIITAYELCKKLYYYLSKKKKEIIDQGIEKETIPPKPDREESKIVSQINQKTDLIIKKFNKLPRSSKILLITSIILAFLFIQSIVWLGQKQDQETEVKAYNQLIVEIQNKINESEASVIYKEEEKARNLLLEAQNLLKQIPQDSKKHKEGYEVLAGDLQSRLEELRHITNISEPIVIADFASFSPDNPNFNNREIIKINNKIFSYNSNDNSIYEINLDNSSITLSEIGLSNSELLYGIIIEENEKEYILFYRDQDLVKFDPQNKSLKFVDASFSENADIKSLKIYNRRLYVLDINNKQIFKHSKTSTGFTHGVPWLTDGNVDLSNAISMAIDGDIYVLKSDGNLLKLFNGRSQTFEIKNIDPALSSPTKIYADVESDYLYILEPLTKRLIVLDKEGKLKVQYYSEQFDDLKDFFVSESEKKIYLLNGTKIFGIMAVHL